MRGPVTRAGGRSAARIRCYDDRAGGAPADQVNPVVVAAMHEVGIDLVAESPKVLTAGAVQASDVVIMMGCGDECTYVPGRTCRVERLIERLDGGGVPG